MATNAKIFRINYKSDFILTLTSDAGWMTPFCIKFWTSAPSQAYYVGFDGTTYTHCAYDPSEPTKLQVQFDDHHLPIGDLMFQVAYHFTVADFPNDTEDEVLNQANITVDLDGEQAKVMLDFTGETAPEIQFALPAYANEAQRIANEQQRIANEQTRIQNEEARIAAEATRQQNESQRIRQEEASVSEFATLKLQSQDATSAANTAAALANEKAALAADKAALAGAAATLANEKAQLAADKAVLAASAAQLANDKAALAQQKAEYAQQQGDYAKAQGDTALADHRRAESDHTTAADDHTRAESDHGIAADDHTQAGNDHTRAESDHGIAADDHTRAGNDNIRAESDHGIAADDHTQAGNDHTRAESDHGIAADDHTQAGNDHTRAESDHTRAEQDHTDVQNAIEAADLVYDISKANAVGGVLATYADLSAALGVDGANVPVNRRQGGMTVKFVLTSDNKYVQARCMAQNFTTDVTQWQGVDDELIAGSKNLVESGGVMKAVNKGVIKLDGIPGTYSYFNTNVTGGHRYLIEVFDTNWDITGTNLYYAFKIGYKKNGAETVVQSCSADDFPTLMGRYWTLVAPDDAESIFVGAWGVNGQDIKIAVTDLNLIENFSNTVVARALRNGSNGNPGNAVTVSTSFEPLNGASYVSFITSRINTQGCKYRIGWCLTSSYEDIGKTIPTSQMAGYITSGDYSFNTNFDLSINISAYPNAVGISFTIAECDDSLQYHALRLGDFKDELILFAKSNTLIDKKLIINSTKPLENKAISAEFGLASIENGSIGNLANLNVVHTCVVPVNNAKMVHINIGRPNASGCYYSFGYSTTTSLKDIGRTDAQSNWVGLKERVNYSEKTTQNAFTITSDVVGIAIVIAEYKNDGTVQQLRASDFNNYRVTISDNAKIVDTYDECIFVKDNLLPDILSSYRYRNGSQGNPGNTWVITLYGASTNAIPVTPGQRLRLQISNEPEEGYSYFYRLYTYDKSNPANLYGDGVIRNEGTSVGHPIDLPIEIAEGELGMTIQLYEALTAESPQQEGESIPLRVENFPSASMRILDITNVFDLSVIEFRIKQLEEVDVVQNDKIESLEDNVTSIEEELHNGSVYTRNIDKIPMLTASCRFAKLSNTSKDFQMLIVADSHGDNVAVANGIEATNKFDKIDALIHVGDCVSNYIEVNTTQAAIWKNLVADCEKPFFFVMGNHEKGTYPQILGHPYDADLYRDFIKPSVDAGWLVSGEYTDGKCYYYHDFTSLNIRLIVLDEYEVPYIIDDTIWEPITYDSSISNYVYGHTYTAGSKVNVNRYTEYSFQAKSDVTIDNYYGTKVPCYKYRRGYRWISQTQAQWFLDTLASTPSGYRVIVACHNPFSANSSAQTNMKFCQNGNWSAAGYMQNYMINDFIADAINAFQNKESFSTTCSSQYPADMPSYNVSKDFTGVGATFHSLLGGHSHNDLIWKHNTYRQYQVAPVCANTTFWGQAPTADIRRSNSSIGNTIDVDCLTVASFGVSRLGLVKIGVNVTETGDKRDFEIIPLNS